MIDRLCGVLLSIEPCAVVLDVGGVGFRVEVTPGCAEALGRQVGTQVALLTHFMLSGQELAPRLFGFRTPEARALFHLLRGVSGIGPSMALKILGAQATPADVAAAIAREDLKGIKVKGVGPKIAKRVVTELKEKVGTVLRCLPTAAVGRTPGQPLDRDLEEAFLALKGLEFDPGRARELLREIRGRLTEASAEQLVREALLRA